MFQIPNPFALRRSPKHKVPPPQVEVKIENGIESAQDKLVGAVNQAINAVVAQKYPAEPAQAMGKIVEAVKQFESAALQSSSFPKEIQSFTVSVTTNLKEQLAAIDNNPRLSLAEAAAQAASLANSELLRIRSALSESRTQ